jgi:hypothetical protein
MWKRALVLAPTRRVVVKTQDFFLGAALETSLSNTEEVFY